MFFRLIRLIFRVGVFLSYFAIQKSYALLLLSLGLIASFGQGVAYVNVLTQCQRWAPKEMVGFVSGIITSGFASGAFVIAPIESKFVNPLNIKVGPDGFFHDKELLDRVPEMFLLLSGIFFVIQIVGLLFIGEPSLDEAGYEEASLLAALEEDENHGDDESNSDNEAVQTRTETVEVVIPKRQLMTSPTLLMLSMTLLLNAVWVQTTSGLFKAYGQSFIKDDFFLATVNSFAAAANCVSRVLWGIFADRVSIKICYFYYM
jgi:nitrate/nitrite transporter NarK